MNDNEPFPEASSAPKHTFMSKCVRVELEQLIPLKPIKEEVKRAVKYQQILTSVREVGLVEPPVVKAAPHKKGSYFVLDGHLRIEALRDLGVKEVECLVALEDDTYSYNKHVNRASAVQNHRMIVRAANNGASPERLAKALGFSAETIRKKFQLLKGICEEVAELLADTSCPQTTFDVLRRMKSVRQIEAAELMIGNRDFSAVFAKALLLTTPAEQLVNPESRANKAAGVSQSVGLERELTILQGRAKILEHSYSEDLMVLTVTKGYLSTLLSQAQIVRWLTKHHPEYLKEFERIVDMESLPGAARVSGNAARHASAEATQPSA